jgi:PAS domain S-box-containing protein
MLDKGLSKLISGQEIYDFEFEIKQQHTGDIRWVHSRARYSEELKQIHGFIIDITERRDAEDAVRVNEEKYRLILENTSDLIVKIDSKNRFEFVSPSYCELFGKEADELLGHSFMPLVHEDDRESTEEAMKALLKPPYTAYMEQRAFTAKGWKWLSWSDTAVLNDEGHIEYIIGVGHDISERKRSKTELQRTNALLEQKTKELTAVNQDLESFTSAVSHDLKAPIRRICNYLDLVDDIPIETVINGISSSAENLRTIVDAMIKLYRLNSYRQERVHINLSEIAADIARGFEREYSNTEFIIGENLYLWMDPALARIMMQNLIGNAVKYSQSILSPKVYIEKGESCSDERSFVIWDNGIGFEAGLAEEIFKPFKRAHGDDVATGTGVGLSTVERIVKLVGGSIRAESEPGKGARFYLTFPDNQQTEN